MKKYGFLALTLTILGGFGWFGWNEFLNRCTEVRAFEEVKIKLVSYIENPDSAIFPTLEQVSVKRGVLDCSYIFSGRFYATNGLGIKGGWTFSGEGFKFGGEWISGVSEIDGAIPSMF